MSGFSTRSRRDRHALQLEKALLKGKTSNTNTNTEIILDGTARRLQTIYGSHWIMSGLLSFWHHGSCVLQVDFDRDMVTDFGYEGYSMTTNRNLRGWLYALSNAGFVRMESFNSYTQPLSWTFTERLNKNHEPIHRFRGAGLAEKMFERFRDGVPWVQWINGMPWFQGRKYSVDLFKRYMRIQQEIVGDGVSWHWFTADWDKNGEWNKRFIDAAAEKRWHARQARMTT